MFGLFDIKGIDSNTKTKIINKISTFLSEKEILHLTSSSRTLHKQFMNEQLEKLFIPDLNDLFEKVTLQCLTTNRYYWMLRFLAYLFCLSKEEAVESFDEAETDYIKKIASSIEELLGDNNDHDQFEKICLDNLFYASHRYLLHRPNGIATHTNTDNHPFYPAENTNNFYYGDRRIKTTFAKHKEKSKKDIHQYLSTAAVSKTLKTLKKAAPAILNQRETLDEYFSFHKNSYDDVGKAIGTPLFVQEISDCLSVLEPYQKKKTTLDNTKAPLNRLANKINKILSYNHISELMRVIYGATEIIAHYKELSPFDSKQIIKLSIPFGIAISKKIPYNLLDLDFNQQKRQLESFRKINSNKKNNSVRNLAYAGVPWNLLRNAALLYFKLEKSSDKNKILADAITDIAPDYEIILKQLNQLIKVEILLSVGKSQYIDHQNLVPCSALNFLPLLSQYTADIIFSDKIISLLSDIDLSKDHPAETYMRILGVLGECGKNISEHAKGYLQNNFWDCITEIRDKIAHATTFYKDLESLLTQNRLVAKEFREDLIQLKLAYQEFRKSLPNTWIGIKQFYRDPIHTTNNPLIGVGTINVYDAICPILTPQDIQELNATNTMRVDISKAKTLILSIINNEIAANTINQNDFESALNDLNRLSQAHRRKLLEHYKKLRSNKIITALNNEVITALTNLQSLNQTEVDNFIKETIRTLRSFTTSQSLNDKLKKYDLNVEAVDCWELKRKKLMPPLLKSKFDKQQSSDIKNLTFSKLDQGFSASINLIKQLERLQELTQVDPTSFMQDVSESYRVENYFVRTRAYIETIREAINYLKDYSSLSNTSIDLAKLYAIVEYKLEKIRLYGNNLAHLHDETELSTVTPAGRRFFTHQHLMGILDGYKGIVPSLTSQIKAVALIMHNTKTSLATSANKPNGLFVAHRQPSYYPPSQLEPSEDKRNDPSSIHYCPRQT